VAAIEVSWTGKVLTAMTDTIQSELCKKDLDILAKTIIAEEAIVKKAGGKYKMLPLFNETTAKIKALLENDKPVRDGEWTSAEIELINEKVRCVSHSCLVLTNAIPCNIWKHSANEYKMRLITTKPVIYLINLTMKDYLRQKCKYLPKIAEWVKAHGGAGTDIIPFSVEWEEKLWSLREDKEAQDKFIEESKVKSRLGKITTEGLSIHPSNHSFPSPVSISILQ